MTDIERAASATGEAPALRARRPGRPHVLQLLHSRPGELGGTEKHFWRLVEGLSAAFDVSVLQPGGAGYLLTTIWDLGDGGSTREELLIPGEPGRGTEVDDPAAAQALETVLDLFHFDAVHIQNMVHHSLAPLAVLADFDGPVSCSVRDLYLACPHHWLLYRNRVSCGIPDDLAICARCLPETRGLEVEHLQSFRDTVAARLDVVDHWVFASQSAVDHLLRVYDLDPRRIEVIEHGAIIEPRRDARSVDRARVLDEPLRLAFVGIGWAKKGLAVVNELADGLVASGIEIHHFGELREAISPNVRQHGPYDNDALPELLHAAGIQIVLLPGPFLETFGHVMTEALIAGLPVIGHRHGALGERIRRHDVGWTIDPEDVPGIRRLIEDLDRCRLEVLRATERAVAVQVPTVAATCDRYAALYEPTGAAPSVRRPGTRSAMTEVERLRRELQAMAALNRRLEVQLTRAQAGTSGGRRRPAPLRAAARLLPLPARRRLRALRNRGRRLGRRARSAVGR